MGFLREFVVFFGVLFGVGYAYGYCKAPKPPELDPLHLRAEPRNVPPPAMVFSVADLRALKASGRLGEELTLQYWLGVVDMTEALAATERASGYRRSCCGLVAPFAYVAIRQLTAPGFDRAALTLAATVTDVAGARSHGASAMAIWMGPKLVADPRAAIQELAVAGHRGGPPQRIPVGDALPPRQYSRPEVDCGQ